MSVTDPRLCYPHVARNREPILEVLRRVLPPHGLILEVASGSGEHAVFFAKNLTAVIWQPTDTDVAALASIDAHRAAADVPNLRSPMRLDVMSVQWPVERADALVCINMIHISPWPATEALMAGARRTLRPGHPLYLYGPYKIDGRHTAPSNKDFDDWLQAQNTQWGVRNLADVAELAARYGFALAETVPMPANNLSVVFR